MPYPERLVFVRHGQSEANLVQKGLISPEPEGFRDRPDINMRLSAKGVEQAQITGQWLKENIPNFDRFYVSPFVRAVETAITLDISEKWLLDDLIRERDWGEYGKYSREEQERLFVGSTMLKKEFAWYWKPVGGESLSTGVRLRVNSLLTHLSRLEDVKNVICVSHGEFISTSKFVIEKMTPHQWVEMDEDPDKSIFNAMVYEYSRVNPKNSEDVRMFFAWRRAICPWDMSKSHDNGEWVEIKDKEYLSTELRQFINQYPNLVVM